MKIAFDVAPLLGPRTGVGRFAAELLSHLMELERFDYNLFALTRRPERGQLPKGPNITTRHIGLPARLAVTAWEKTGWPGGSVLTGDADVVHGTNFWFPPKTGASGVLTIHDLTFKLYPEFCTPQVRRYAWIVPRVLKRTQIVLTLTRTVKSQVAEHLGFPLERIVVTPGGVSMDPVVAQPEGDPRSRPPIDGPYVLFLGTREPRKNLSRLIEGFALSASKQDVRLVIAGPKGWGGLDLAEDSRRVGVSDRVIFLDHLPDGAVAGLIAGARAFVFPSVYEGFGLPPLEAMALGVPVASSMAPPMPEVLGEAPKYFDPHSAEDMAQAIDSAVSDEQWRTSAIELGRRQASRYRWEETARLTAEAYELASS